MKKLKVANIHHASGIPFECLKDVDFIDYEANLPTENARKLHEGEVDVALIPSPEYANHGAYIALDFGFACETESELVTLVAHKDIRKLNTIYVYKSSSSSSLLLRLLLSMKWKSAPRIVRSFDPYRMDELMEDEGMLALREKREDSYEHFEVREDLVRCWHELTGLPFVFLIWATRPGVLDKQQYKVFSDTFHLAVKAHETKLRDNPLKMKDYIGARYFYLDPRMQEAVDYSFKKAYNYHLLPLMKYQFGTFSLLSQEPKKKINEKPVSELLQDIVDGERIGVRDGIRLANEASLTDLGLAADMARQNLYTERTVSYLHIYDNDSPYEKRILDKDLHKALKRGVQRILLLPSSDHMHELEVYENLLHEIKFQNDVFIDGFGAPFLIRLARYCDMHVKEIISRLVTAGLDSVPAMGGGMLIDRIMKKKGIDDYEAAEWIRAMQWVHRYGAKSTCSLTISPYETWEERLIHLQKLRVMQDENPGFRCFITVFSYDWKGPVDVEEKLRASAIARLYLDNIPSAKEVQILRDPVPGMIALSFGENEIELPVTEDNQVEIDTALRMFRMLWDLGLDFSADTFQDFGIH